MHARLEPTGDAEWNWQVVDDKGPVLVRLGGATDAVTGPALASLVADHGYPSGQWIPDGDGFRFAAT